MMYKISIIENPTIPILVPTKFSGTSRPVLQYRVKARVGDVDALLQRIDDARDECDMCYFEYRDIHGEEQSYPIVYAMTKVEQFDDGTDMNVLYLDFIVF